MKQQKDNSIQSKGGTETMRRQRKPIRYGKPCMTDLPPELGRMIFDAIMNPPPADHTILEREAARAERRLAEIAEEIKRNAASAN